MGPAATTITNDPHFLAHLEWIPVVDPYKIFWNGVSWDDVSAEENGEEQKARSKNLKSGFVRKTSKEGHLKAANGMESNGIDLERCRTK
jgi:hypothetical protein